MGSRTVIFLWGLFLPWCLSRRYFYQTQLLSWDDAQQNCRQHYTDLATFESMDDISSLQRPPGVVGNAWIGLREDPQTWLHMGNASTSWRWSSTGQTSQSGFSNWVFPNPNNLLGEACVHLNSAGKWIDWGCELLFPSVCFSGLFLPWCLSRRYFYQTQLLSWDDAQQNCRQHYTDLATFESMEDISSLQRPPGVVGNAWIGLRDDPQTWQHMGNASTSWRWSSTGQTSQSGFSSWFVLEPNNFLGEACVQIDALGFWVDLGCEATIPSVCFSGSAGNIQYVHNPTLLSWSDAQKHCRENYVDLATIESVEDNNAVKAVVPFLTAAWTGLHRVPFAWSDHSPSTFRNWISLRPDNFGGFDFCAYETSSHTWEDAPCDWKLQSLCYKPDWETRRTTVRQTVSAAIDLTDPAVLLQIQQQLREIVGENRTDVELQLKMERMELQTDHQPQCLHKLK